MSPLNALNVVQYFVCNTIFNSIFRSIDHQFFLHFVSSFLFLFYYIQENKKLFIIMSQKIEFLINSKTKWAEFVMLLVMNVIMLMMLNWNWIALIGKSVWNSWKLQLTLLGQRLKAMNAVALAQMLSLKMKHHLNDQMKRKSLSN